jgi:hypothetical protein
VQSLWYSSPEAILLLLACLPRACYQGEGAGHKAPPGGAEGCPKLGLQHSARGGRGVPMALRASAMRPRAGGRASGAH